MTTPAASVESAPATPAKPAALWEDLIDIFTSPAAVFTRRRDGRFWLAMLAFTLVGALTFVVARPSVQPMLDRQVALAEAKIDANRQVPAEQRAAQKGGVRRFVESPWAMAFPVLILPISLFAGALTAWSVGKAFGSEASYGQALAVISIAGLPRVVLGLITAGVTVALGRQIEFAHQLTLGPGTVLGDVGAVASGVLQRIDVGLFWQTVLLGLGLSYMGRVERRVGGPVVIGQVSRAKGLTIAAIVWAFATLFTVWSAYNQSAA